MASMSWLIDHHGGRRLSGRVAVEGNKNAALPLLAACVLTPETCELRNVPRIRDVAVMVELLRSLGAEVEGQGTTSLRVTCRDVDRPSRIRASSAGFAAPCCCWVRSLAEPAGRCWRRRAAISRRAGRLRHTCGRSPRWARASSNAAGGHRTRRARGLTGASMYLLEASVTGTETALLAAAQAAGVTEIRNAACEPHVVELCEFLAAMGVGSTGIGSLHASRRAAGAAARRRATRFAATTSRPRRGASSARSPAGTSRSPAPRAEDLEPITAVLARWASVELEDGRFAVNPSTLVAARRITTGLWPGFPSDIVSLVTVLATQADGRTLVHDWMYELRLFALEQLSAMRADLFLCDPHRIIVTGPTQAARPHTRQPRHPVGHGARRRGARRRGREHGAGNRDGRARLRESRRKAHFTRGGCGAGWTVRRQKAEGRRQKAQGRRHKAEVRRELALAIFCSISDHGAIAETATVIGPVRCRFFTRAGD